MQSVDLNCDMGEGTGNDELIMPWISSANIACGFHAGDADTMKRTIELALQHNVAIGAHPSFVDRANFGRTEMVVSENELYDLIAIQLSTLSKIASSFYATIHHVKPHGALYNMAAKDAAVSHVIARAVKDLYPGLVLYGLSKSHLISEAKKMKLTTASEVFADRTYRDDGSLTPRSTPGALIESEEASLQQVLQMVDGYVISTSGNHVSIDAETICIHGDSAHAHEFAKKINETLQQKGIAIKTI